MSRNARALLIVLCLDQLQQLRDVRDVLEAIARGHDGCGIHSHRAADIRGVDAAIQSPLAGAGRKIGKPGFPGFE